MSESKLLDPVLDGTQIPHQPLLVIADNPLVPGLPLFREVLRRSSSSTLVTVLHPPTTLVPPGSSCTTIDLTSYVSDYNDASLTELEIRISTNYTTGSIFIDALDLLAEDSSSSALRLFRTLLNLVRDAKARLVLLLPAHSSLLTSITPPTQTPTITMLTPHPPALLTHLSRAYLVPIESSGRYWQLLETASSRRLAEDLTLKGELDASDHTIVQVTVRKAVGGTKGMSRSLEAWTPSGVQPISAILDVSPITSLPPATSGAPPKTHADLDLPFNLHLTDQQKAARQGVPLPYAHEGEGAAVDLEFDDEEDEDDEEI